MDRVCDSTFLKRGIDELQWLVVSIWSVFRTVETVSILENLRQTGYIFFYLSSVEYVEEISSFLYFLVVYPCKVLIQQCCGHQLMHIRAQASEH